MCTHQNSGSTRRNVMNMDGSHKDSHACGIVCFSAKYDQKDKLPCQGEDREIAYKERAGCQSEISAIRLLFTLLSIFPPDETQRIVVY